MDFKDLCMGCMEKKISSEAECPACGFIDGTEPESPLFLKPGTVLENKYLIGRVLGQGGFGITYLAWDMNLNIKLAIKEYFPQDLATRASGHTEVSAYTGSMGSQYEYGLDKFLQEARTLAQFEEHPNIVSVRDFFKQNGTAYFVMSYVEGITLKQHLANSGGKLPVEQARGIMMPVMDALKEVHKVNVLHRDVSPDNIFINTKGQVILIDFGAARQAIGEKGHSLSIILKPGYAPEEQYRSKGVQGPWTDIYAVAATFYHLVTGSQPPEALERMVEDELILPSETGAEVSETEEKAILKALAVRATDRFQSIEDFQKGLQGEAPVEIAAPPKPGEDRLVSQDGFAQKIRQVPIGLLAGGGGAFLVALVLVALWAGGLFNSGDSAVTSETSEEQPEVINTDGNTPGNLANGGLVAVQGDMVYFRSNDGGSIYEADLTTEGASLLSTDSAWYINVAGDWIYYSNRDDNDRIYRIGTDGSGRTPVTRSKALFVTLEDDWLYYLDQDENNQIYKVNTSGGEQNLITEDSALVINVIGNRVYYINADDENRIYRVNTDGSGREVLSDASACCLSVTDNYIFYSNESDGNRLYKMMLDGTGSEALNNRSSLFINAIDEWVYYADQSESNALAKIRFDGTDEQILSPGPVYIINVAGSSIFYSDQPDPDTIYGVGLDNGNPESIENSF